MLISCLLYEHLCFMMLKLEHMLFLNTRQMSTPVLYSSTMLRTFNIVSSRPNHFLIFVEKKTSFFHHIWKFISHTYIHIYLYILVILFKVMRYLGVLLNPLNTPYNFDLIKIILFSLTVILSSWVNNHNRDRK